MPSAEARARRAAQRRLAKEIHEGTFKPSQIGAKARKVATERQRRIIDRDFDIAIKLNRARDAAFANMIARVGDYVFFKRETVEANVYGGETSESGSVPGMSVAEAEWTAQADTEEIRSRAEPQVKGNPWFYH